MLDAYSRVQTAHTAVINLLDLKQGASESVMDFGSIVARIIFNPNQWLLDFLKTLIR
jgi:hypothetical protein